MMVVVPPHAAARVPVSNVSIAVGAAERQLHVGVRVDAAGDHVLAGRVDDGVDGCRDIGAEKLRAGLQHGDDRLAVDEDVGLRRGRSPRRRCRR